MSEEQPLAKVISPERVNFTAEGLEYLPDIVYDTVEGHALKMDIIHPKVYSNPMPVILWYHGGGWSSEDLDRKYRPETHLARLAKLGFFCASVDYRLVQEAHFPAQLQDAKCAIRYLRAHSQEYDLDREHFGVWGESAGGQIVSMLGVSGDVGELEGQGAWQGETSRVQAVCDWYGPSDLAQSALQKANGPDAWCKKMCGTDYGQAKPLLEILSPIYYAHRPNPPFLICHGDEDRLVPLSESVRLHEALTAAGNDSTLMVIPGQGHGFFEGEAYYERMIDFFVTHLML